MNAKIAELAKQANLSSNKDTKKFANLVIAECIKILVTSDCENISDAIWDFEEQLGVNVAKVLDSIEL
jgi:hypothetical protein